ncbi:MAG TPA: hypothetical protein VG406_00410 [Isosphaeraceae bacterium]|jgi:hypothetical protein|nr:hypothetical protein [Isosphaeraceae bacterium]
MSSYAVRRRPDSPPRTLGTLNIVFGIIALCWGLCNDTMLMALPTLMQLAGESTTTTQRMLDEKQRRTLESLKEEEAAAKTQAEKDRLRKAQASLRASKVVVTSTAQTEMLSKFQIHDRRFFVHYATALVTGLILNTAMIVAGVGLLRLRPWGRTLSLWVAGLHIVRLVAMTASMVVIVGPIWTAMSASMTAATATAGMDPEAIRSTRELNRAIDIALQAGMFVLGLIYPIVTLWLLNTRSSLAALGLAKSPEPLPFDDWPASAPAPSRGPAADVGPSKLAGVLPDARGPRRIGILGIIIALALLMTCNLPSMIFTAFLPAYVPMMRAMEKTQAKQFADERLRGIEEARAKEAAARTEAEWAEAHAEVQAREATPPQPPQPQAMFFEAMDDRRVKPYLWLDAATGIALNVAMFVGAIGLIQLREWGRKTSNWVAAIKVLRIAAALALGVGVVAPAIGLAMGDSLGKFLAQMPTVPRRGTSPAELKKFMTIGWTAGLIVFELLALVWPVIVLWVLSRPGARAACQRPGRGGRDLS